MQALSVYNSSSQCSVTKRMSFKGYLHYKTITSQNVSSEAQV